MQEPKKFTQTKTTNKRYYARVPGSRFCHEDGTETYFFHGFADIKIKEHQEEIDLIIDKNPNIYLPDHLPEKSPEIAQNALGEAELAAQEAVLRGVKGKTAQDIGPIEVNAGMPSDPNASTVDQELQAAVFKNAPKVIGPGANAIKPISAAQVAVVAAAPSVSR